MATSGASKAATPVFAISSEEATETGLTEGPAVWCSEADLRHEVERLLEDLLGGQPFSKLVYTTSEGRVHTSQPAGVLDRICQAMGWSVAARIVYDPLENEAASPTS